MPDHTVEILLVEDNPNDLELALHSLKQHNLANRVQVARDGVEALDFIFGTGPYTGRRLHDGPTVVLLDLKLPLMDGLEVLRRVKSDPQTRALPVVVLTSSREERASSTALPMTAVTMMAPPSNVNGFGWSPNHRKRKIGTNTAEPKKSS